MHYDWSWWWWLTWIMPLALVMWRVFGLSSRRYVVNYRYELPVYRRRRFDDPKLHGGGRRLRGRGPRGYRRSDGRIEEDVNDELMMCDEIDASDVEVQVEGGKVRLAGSVETRYERRLAEHLADCVPGVMDVENTLIIAPTGRHGTAAQAPAPGR